MIAAPWNRSFESMKCLNRALRAIAYLNMGGRWVPRSWSPRQGRVLDVSHGLTEDAKTLVPHFEQGDCLDRALKLHGSCVENARIMRFAVQFLRPDLHLSRRQSAPQGSRANTPMHPPVARRVASVR